MLSIYRILAHIIFRTRSFNDKCLKKFSSSVKSKRILELGSGKKVNGKESYSGKKYFDSSNEFIQSDINPDFGYKVVDVVNMDYEKEFDVILCMNVLEHVFDFEKGVSNLHNALKKGGLAAIFVPTFYPLHDEPNDYWRFTEHSLRKIFDHFEILELKHSGLRRYPFAYFMIVKKV